MFDNIFLGIVVTIGTANINLCALTFVIPKYVKTLLEENRPCGEECLAVFDR